MTPENAMPNSQEQTQQVSELISRLESMSEQQILVSALDLFKRNELQTAEVLFKVLLKVNPFNYIALYSLGVIQSIAGNIDNALTLINSSININPNFARSFLLRSVLYRNRKSLSKALIDARMAISLDPSLTDANLQIMALETEIRNASAAIGTPNFVNLSENQPSLAPPIVEVMAQADHLSQSGKQDEAIELYVNYLKQPVSEHRYVALFNLAVLLNSTGEVEKALSLLSEAIQLKPDFFMAYLSLGTIKENNGQAEAALEVWQASLLVSGIDAPEHQEDKIKILNNIGRVLENLRRYDASEDALFKSLAIDPSQAPVLHHWIHLRQKQCKWPVVYGTHHTFEEVIQSASPLSMLGLSTDPNEQLASAKRFVQEKVQVFERMVPANHKYQHEKIRIGYLSSNLSMHAVSLLTVELFETHDRDKFEIHAFCWSPEDGTPFRDRVKRAFDHFHPISNLTDAQAAELIQSLEIDVVVDLQGLTSGARPDLIARGAAPVQIAYLGYPGSTALPYVDYVIADHFILPQDLQAYFTEKPLYLPTVFQVSDSKRPISPTQTREFFNLPEDQFVFCVFNNNYKFTPEVFEAWMRILRVCKKSVLWLLEDNVWSKENLKVAARSHGINPDRLIFAGRIAPADYLARFRVADLFLDTTPYNAGTTANDALWAGLPILTLSGQTYVSRMAGSLLNSVQLNDLITFDIMTYESKAIYYYEHPEQLKQLREKLALAKEEKRLFNTETFCREFEDQLRKIMA
jgi:predicted O-linked N-acetylglucosamine transferase (SPINDLY family)